MKRCFSHAKPWHLVALAAIVILAAVLRLVNLESLGYVNHYYTAAMVSMLKSWHNFFFVAAEPGGSITVDKPPVGLWFQAISVLIFGLNTFGLLLPEILAGLLSVVLIGYLVKRSFGPVAGLLASLALAITPVVVATDRNNTMDSLLILCLLLTAWAFIKATETSKVRFLLLGAFFVGIGFNIKMLEAYLPLPAFYALYFLGSREGIGKKIWKLALTTLIILIISFSWVTIFELTPANQRPYVGSSGDNSEISLIFGYNGLQRLIGLGQSLNNQNGVNNRGFSQLGPSNLAGGRQSGKNQGNSSRTPSPTPSAPSRGIGPAQLGAGVNPSNTGNEIGQVGLMRLLEDPLYKDASWLLPISLFGWILILFRQKPHWPLAPKHQSFILWGVWFLTDALFFSVANFFHEYYLSMIAAPIVVLFCICLHELWELHEQKPWLANILLLAITSYTLDIQIKNTSSYLSNFWWKPVAMGLLFGGGTLIILATARRIRGGSIAGFSLIVAAILVSPAIWSGLTVLYPSANQSLPAAYAGQTSGPNNHGGLQINQALLNYLEPRTQNITYLLAVPSSMQGSDYVIVTGRPVLYIGGFMGLDEIVTSDELAKMVADHEIRFIYWDSGNNGFKFMGNSTEYSDVTTWITNNCTIVDGFNTRTQNSGAPDGTSSAESSQQEGYMEISLYDCGD